MIKSDRFIYISFINLSGFRKKSTIRLNEQCLVYEFNSVLITFTQAVRAPTFSYSRESRQRVRRLQHSLTHIGFES